MAEHLTGLLPPVPESVLARRGEGGYAQYRIPALGTTAAGTVLAAYDGRPNLDDLPSPIDLLLRRSHDSGQSWESQKVVRTGTGLQGFGDPSILVDQARNRIFIFHAAGTLAGFFEAKEGLEPEDWVQHVDVSISDDDGETWTHRRLTDQLKRPGIAGIFAASGNGIHVPYGPFAGRLIQPMVIREEGVIKAAAAFSDDHGHSWTLGEPVGVGTNESAIAVLPDGQLLLHSRATPRRLASVSKDGGTSWSLPSPIEALPDPNDNGSLVALGSILVASNNLDPELRRNTALSLSKDGGHTWPHQLVLCGGSSGYSSVAPLPDGRLGVFYEREGYSELVFAAIEQSDLENAGPVDPVRTADTHPPQPQLEVLLRSITPGLPAEWQHIGEHYTYPIDDSGVDPSAWKEVGQGYGPSGGMILGTREAQLLNYGPPHPGLRAGDILAFHVRIRLPSNTGRKTVGLEYPDGSMELQNIENDGKAVFGPPYPKYTVTNDDVAVGQVSVRFSVPALRLALVWRMSTVTGKRLSSTAP